MKLLVAVHYEKTDLIFLFYGNIYTWDLKAEKL